MNYHQLRSCSGLAGVQKSCKNMKKHGFFLLHCFNGKSMISENSASWRSIRAIGFLFRLCHSRRFARPSGVAPAAPDVQIHFAVCLHSLLLTYQHDIVRNSSERSRARERSSQACNKKKPENQRFHTIEKKSLYTAEFAAGREILLP